ncbi:MAG: TraR/DksA family transcriptional regulator [Nitrososphaerota archaeon]
MNAMSENPELTPEVLAELRTQLVHKRATLRAALGLENEQASLGANADIVGDEGDASVDLQEVDVEAATAADLRVDLADVDHALAKMVAGTYGICERCGRPIPLARLRVLPEARYDVEYEEDVEAGRAPR